jgi:glycosyltransferase involved in cell wall biosynthesis
MAAISPLLVECPEKRPDWGIEIARRAELPLTIAAKVDKVDRSYYKARIKPLLRNPLIEFIGEIGDSNKAAFLGNATALLFPIDWPEPFGLVLIEAMAHGTPGIAFGRGSVPEIIDHGITGFIVDSIDEAAAAIPLAKALDRGAIRRPFRGAFLGGPYGARLCRAIRRSLGPQAIRAWRPSREKDPPRAASLWRCACYLLVNACDPEIV